MQPIETIQVNDNKVIEIYVDDNPQDPRDSDGNAMMCMFHNQYTFPNDAKLNHKDFHSWDEMAAHIEKEYKPVAMLALWLYDHSGLHLSSRSFHGRLPQGHAEFDSGQVGFIFATREQVKEWFAVEKITKKVRERVLKDLEDQVETYNQYLEGDVYGYVIKEFKDEAMEDVTEDSCWGFFGLDYCIREAKVAAGVA